MASTIASRANFYDMLGLAPTASENDIRRAFAREMGMFRPMGESAQIGLAFETLRNPAKRRAYDEALGLTRPVPAPTAMSFRMSGRFIGAAVAGPREAQVQPEAFVAPQAQPQPEPEPPAFIAAPSPSADVPAPQVQADEPAPRDPEPDLERLIGQLQGLRKSTEQVPIEPKLRSIEWNSTAATIGGVVLATIFIGVWAGTHAQDAEPAAAQAASSVALPPAKPFAATKANPTAEPFAAADVGAQRPVAFVPTERRRTRASAQPEQAAATDDAAAGAATTEAADSAAVVAAADPVAADSAPAVATPASLPLPKSVIARTIERIGYSCGSVAWAAAADSAGTYKITCTSGQSYQAKPVRGRYRFSRLGH